MKLHIASDMYGNQRWGGLTPPIVYGGMGGVDRGGDGGGPTAYIWGGLTPPRDGSTTRDNFDPCLEIDENKPCWFGGG